MVYFSMKITKNRYLAGFATIVFVLFLIRLIFPSVTKGRAEQQPQEPPQVVLGEEKAPEKKEAPKQVQPAETPAVAQEKKEDKPAKKDKNAVSRFFNADGSVAKHRIWSVPRYVDAFPDSQQVQIVAATRWGVQPVLNRADAEDRKNELVYVQSSPYYHVDKMNRSIPYLVPRAAVLLNDLGRAYYDSLQIKGIPLHQFIITSVLRTKEDVSKLRNYNGNATENSCHLYGTTFDICYNRYKTVMTAGEPRRMVRNDSLKWVLSEVLNDFRNNGRCYIKYEVKQGCFHITVR